MDGRTVPSWTEDLEGGHHQLDGEVLGDLLRPQQVVERLQGGLLEAVGGGEGEVEEVLVSLQAEEERDAKSIRQTEVVPGNSGSEET